MLLPYISVTFFLVITPGATTAVVIQQTLARGHAGGVAAAIGAAGGNFTHALAAGLGLSVVMRQWPQALDALRVIGALYLCLLAVQSIRRAWLGSRTLDTSHRDATRTPASRQGLTVTLLNPSVATFYLAVLPGFLEPAAGFPAFAGLAAIHITLALSCHLLWALALGSMRDRLASPAGLRTIDGLAGLALLMLGVRMLV